MRGLLHGVLRYYTRRFPISKGKARIIALLWRPLSFGQYRRQTTLHQANIRINCDLTKFIQRQLYFYGSFEEQQCRYWMNLASKARIIFDIGANVGLYALLAAARNPNANIHAFEPTPELVDALAGNIRLNGITNVTVAPVAVGKVSGKGFLHYCAGSDGSNEGMNYITDQIVQDSDMPVETISLDDYCGQRQIRYVDLLKMDIEGGEFDALLGAQNLLRAQAIGCIFIELTEWVANRSGHSTSDVKRLLSEAGYRIYQPGARGLAAVQLNGIHRGGHNVIALADERKFALNYVDQTEG